MVRSDDFRKPARSGNTSGKKGTSQTETQKKAFKRRQRRISWPKGDLYFDWAGKVVSFT